MKDLSYWRGAIYNAKTLPAIKAIGEELAQFQSQSDFLGGDPKLNEAQLATLRTQYSLKFAEFRNHNGLRPEMNSALSHDGLRAVGLKEFKPPDSPPEAAAQEVKPPLEPEESVVAKTCAQCGNPIPIERLEAIPTTVKCVSCQQKAETGEELKIEATKCKKCGSAMVWRMTKNLRPAKYFLGCSNYPKCHYIGVSSF